MVHIWVINEHASSHSRLKSYVQKGLHLPALLYITEDEDKRGLQVQQIDQSAANWIFQNGLTSVTGEPGSTPTEPHSATQDSAQPHTKLTPSIPPLVDLPAEWQDQPSLSQPQPDAGDPQTSHTTITPPSHEELSVRELQTLVLLGQGISVSGIARNLALSVKTISTYRARALEKLQLNTTADLIRYAVEHLLVPSGSMTQRSI